MSPFYLLTLLLFPLSGLSNPLKNATTVTHIPPDVTKGTADVDFTSSMFNFDSPRVGNFNESSWDWWYFDALDLNSNASVVVVLFAAKSAAFPWKTPTNLTSVSFEVTAANGTALLATQMNANGATVTTERGKDGVSGDWEGTGISFRSEDGMNRYIVSVDSPELGITGEMILNTVAPSHYPCTSNIANADTEIIPTIGWANAIPDSNASAHFTIRDEATNSTQVIEFSEGIGYHDKNWGSTPFSEATSGWEWGHGRVGPYSVVWFDAVDWDNTEYVSGYVAKDGEILSAGCHASSLKARPEVSNGAEGDFPPLANSTIPTGFTLEFEMEDGNVLAVKTSNDVPLAGTGSYRRWLGSLTGSLGGDSETFEGYGLWEMFNIPLLLEGSSGN